MANHRGHAASHNFFNELLPVLVKEFSFRLWTLWESEKRERGSNCRALR